MKFEDRIAAGQQLADQLQKFQQQNLIILALPRGGVPVAFQVAKRLDAPLDVLVVRKIGAPNNPEFGIGAIAENQTMVLDQKSIGLLQINQSQLEKLRKKEEAELQRRIETYRQGRSLPDLKKKVVILVDDGLATGVTAKAAVQAVKKIDAKKIIFAAPVCAPDSANQLNSEVEHVICSHLPQNLRAIGKYYRNFAQTSDETVVELLQKYKQD